ncbi:MAG: cation diffusion facilitator family transporter [Armatimonadota bacterium]|nr:cation diffusion facilitator family transporter [Armatimonadota bacterium]MDR7427496.1 cation diffusion facilitator family transporter [Armatimonadota bacterium]MDR7475210.1 cation diffusion facilitator family transporter [Armatimonadota bacterium]MDR7540327.1 cation diffusion facilitator family transporter [Armatimonadota bacterium]
MVAPAPVRVRAALLAVAVGVLLLVLKFVAYLLTGSAAILSDAAESVVNVLAANIALFSLVVASRPPDEGHQYGHGKAEYLSSASEGVMILLAGAVVMVNAARRLLHPAPLAYLPLGVGLVALAALVNYLVARWLLRVSRERDSAALEADARHLFADVATSLAVITGLGAQLSTGLLWLDPLVGLLVGAHVIRMGARVYRASLSGLMDTRLPAAEEARIRAILADHTDEIVEYHALRTRKAGRDRFIDLHLVLHRTLSVGQAHALCDDLEAHVQQALPHTDITIHVEPCTPACARCATARP